MADIYQQDGASSTALKFLGGSSTSALYNLWQAGILKLRGVPLYPPDVHRLQGGNQGMIDAFEQRLGRVLAVSRRFAFPLRQRHAVDYVQPGVALVADAAHTIHPLAGQGINLGLQDVAVLAEEILSGRARGAKPGQLELLRRYQRRRKGENLMMMAAMDGFKKLFEQQALPLRWLRNVGMRGVNQLPPVKQQLMRHAMGLG